MFVKIPQNPGDPIYRQGKTLGPELKNWFRGKTGNGRYRLFFRYDSSAKLIVYAWVNDEQSLRTYGSVTDAYAVFRRMVLQDGNPPKDWGELMAAAKEPGAVKRARGLAGAQASRRT
jgi:toxin YhaV